jgi:hypothetical protein
MTNPSPEPSPMSYGLRVFLAALSVLGMWEMFVVNPSEAGPGMYIECGEA